ncbi:RDD family protein [Xanthomonas euvesicatoria]|uniref:RDD family membrane protein YckC n=1 Tax=Xanthomonas euvesicatoria TaxID=456327 RepID=A0AAW3U624_XANEU|nr:RDD family protein [Xanthomonas euvesicatoria]MBB4724611.1 putative RDD family membrane protein YckC [Xanthomonas euvesicatoria]MBB4871171.1 putative RDD family membrane protein YckC [Xanthomonas euvesicatoria]
MDVSTGEAAVVPPSAAGFWRRLAAFIVDCLVLAAIGILAGVVLADVFVRMGGYARLLGFFIALAYFGVMNSGRCGGQTLGKRLLGLRVVGKHGALLTLPQSLLRYSVLGVPFFLNGAQIGRSTSTSAIDYVLSLLIFGGTLAILYLYVFNRQGRRSLHDLAVGSSVVMAAFPVAAVRPMPIKRVHLIVVCVLMAAAAALPALTGQLAERDDYKDLLVAHKAIIAESGVQSAMVVHNTTLGPPNVESVVVRVNLSERRIEDIALAERLAKLVIANDKKAAAMSAIHVTMIYGYDLGIASSWSSRSYQFTPEALQASGRVGTRR